MAKNPKSSSSQRERRGATAADILGGGTPQRRRTAKKIDPKWKYIYDKLLQLREDLIDQIEGHAKDAHEETPHYSMHMADSGTDSIDRDYALSLLSSEHEALYEIDQAINRIENGSYGVCELTGKPISKSRLEAIPWARYSVEAQMELEKSGEWPHPHLGRLSSVQSDKTPSPGESDEGDENATNEQQGQSQE